MNTSDIANAIKALQDSIDSIFSDLRTNNKYLHFCLGVDLNNDEIKLRKLCDDFKNCLTTLFDIQNKLENCNQLKTKELLNRFSQTEARAKKLINKIEIKKKEMNWR